MPVQSRQEVDADIHVDWRSCVLEPRTASTSEVRSTQRLEQAAPPPDVFIEDSEWFVVIADDREPRVREGYVAQCGNLIG